MVKIGNSSLVSAKIGTTPVRNIYIGSTKIWPEEQPYTYTLDNLVLHYSDGGSYLKADRSNHAWLTADYKTWQGSTLISTQNVTCSPVYSISPSYNEPVVTEGSSMYWDKANYGTITKAADYVSAKGSYGGLTTQGSVMVNTESNEYSSSYSYRKSFVLTVSGKIPYSGGRFNFSAESYRTEVRNWDSGIEQHMSEAAYNSTLSCDTTGVTLSTSSISGDTSGYVDIPNYTTIDRDRTIIFSLFNAASGTQNYSFTQEKAVSPYYLRLVPSESPQHLDAGLGVMFSVDTYAPVDWTLDYGTLPTGWTVTEDHTNNIIRVNRAASASSPLGISFTVSVDIFAPEVQMVVKP